MENEKPQIFLDFMNNPILNWRNLNLKSWKKRKETVINFAGALPANRAARLLTQG